MREFRYVRDKHGRQSLAVFRLLFQTLLRFPQQCVQVRRVLHATLLAGPRYVSVVVHLLAEYRRRGRELSLDMLSATVRGGGGGGGGEYGERGERGERGGEGEEKSLVHRIDDTVERVYCYLLASFTRMLSCVSPTRRLLLYFPLMERMLMEKNISPLPTLRSLSNYLNIDGSTLSTSSVCTEGDWLVGRNILAICRAALLSHPTSLVYSPLLDILRFVTAYYAEIDTRDQAWLLLRMLTHLSRRKICQLLSNKRLSRGLGGGGGGEHEVEERVDENGLLVVVDTSRSSNEEAATASFRPQIFEGIQQTTPSKFLLLERTLDSRRRVGLLDRGSADIMINEPVNAREEVYQETMKLMEEEKEVMEEMARKEMRMMLLREYGKQLMLSRRRRRRTSREEEKEKEEKMFVNDGRVERTKKEEKEQEGDNEKSETSATIPTSIHLPLRLQFQRTATVPSSKSASSSSSSSSDEEEDDDQVQGVSKKKRQKKQTGGRDELRVDPDRLYSIVLEFSPSPNCVPLDTITLPFLTQETISHPRQSSSLNMSSDLTTTNTTNQETNQETDQKTSTAARNLTHSAPSRFPYAYDLLLSVHMTNPVPTSFQVRMVYNDGAGRSYEGALPKVNMLFEDLFLRLPVAHVFFNKKILTSSASSMTIRNKSNAWIASELFESLWEAVMVPSLGYHLLEEEELGREDDGGGGDGGNLQDASVMDHLEEMVVEEKSNDAVITKEKMTKLDDLKEVEAGRNEEEESAGPAESVKVLYMSKMEVLLAVQRHLGPFLVLKKDDDWKDSVAREDCEEMWYVSKEEESDHMKGEEGGEGGERGGNKGGRVEVRKAVIFLPPRYHLLLKFHISDGSTVVRIRTDRWQLLAEMDRYLDQWKEMTWV